MKPRRWIVVLCVVLIAGGAALYEGVRRLERNPQLEQLLREQISGAVGGDFDFGRLSLGFFSVYLRDVTLSVPLSFYELDISTIKVGFSLRRLATSRADPARSINKIILLSPVLTLHLHPTGYPPGPGGANGTVFDPSAFPVDHLLIQNGTVRIAQQGGEPIAVAGNLEGTISGSRERIGFELRGRMGSLRRNLVLGGEIVRTQQERSRLWVRLDRAVFSRPILIGAVAMTPGEIDGVVEMSFCTGPPGCLPDVRGSVRFNAGTVHTAQEGAGVLDAVGIEVSLEGTRVRVDTAQGVYQGVALGGTGVWDFGPDSLLTFTLRGENIGVHDLVDTVAVPLAALAVGRGWVDVAGSGNPLRGRYDTRLEAGGVSFPAGNPARVRVVAGVAGGVVTIDSCHIESRAIDGRLGGSVRVTDSGPQWELDWSFRIDTLTTFGTPLSGSLVVDGHARTAGAGARFAAMARSADLSIEGMQLGEVHLTLSGDETGGVRFASRGQERDVQLRGFVDLSGQRDSTLVCSLQLSRDALMRIVASKTPLDTSKLGDARLLARVQGSDRGWELASLLQLRGRRLSGSAAFDMRHRAGSPLHWQVQGKGLYAGDSLVALQGSGVLDATLLTIDSLTGFDAARIAGSIDTGPEGDIDLEVHFDRMSFARLNHWFFDGSLPLDSGTVSGTMAVGGRGDSMVTDARLAIRSLALAGLRGLSLDAVVRSHGESLRVLPFTVYKDGDSVFHVDSIATTPVFAMSGRFDRVDIDGFFGALVPPRAGVSGVMSGSFASSANGFPLQVWIRSDTLIVDTTVIDSFVVEGEVEPWGIRFTRVGARDREGTRIGARADVPWGFLSAHVDSTDTLTALVRVEGDLLASVGRHIDSPIRGTGEGWLQGELRATRDGWRIERLGARIESGTLLLDPFVLRPIQGFSLRAASDSGGRLDLALHGSIAKIPIAIVSSHTVPPGLEPFLLGPLDCGVLQVTTPRGGVQLHLPGFQDPGEEVSVEFTGRGQVPHFTLSGPLDRTRITGGWVVRNAEFTFPFLDADEIPWEFDPWPYVTFDMDIEPGNRKVMYYWDLTTRRSRKLVRFVEAWLDPASRITLLGREGDATFRIEGQLRSYKGSAFFGRVFDRRFETGVDFSPQQLPGGGYDNWPIIWGSAEAFSDTSRFDRIKLTLRVQDPLTGGIADRGRIALTPATAERRRSGIGSPDADSLVNFVFHVSSDHDEITGETEREFYRETGMRIGSLEGAGEIMGTLGEQYLHRHFLQRLEKRLARRLGVDVISFETSIASNYFTWLHSRQFAELPDQWSTLAFANLGLTVGRYVLNDALFLKARGELLPVDAFLVPEYSLGVEVQPFRFLLMDFNYGIHQSAGVLEHDPRMNLQLRLPITRLRTFLRF